MAVLTLVSSHAASAQSSAPRYARAYEFALRCFVANNRDESSQRVAYDAALKLGKLQGLSDQRITQDFNRTIATEAIRISRSSTYRTQLLGDCCRIGLGS